MIAEGGHFVLQDDKSSSACVVIRVNRIACTIRGAS